MNALVLRCRCWPLVGAMLVWSLPGCASPPPAEVALTVRPGTTPGEARQIARALSSVVGPPAGGFRIARTASGRELVDLRGRFSQMAIAGRAADGTLRTACVSSAAEAETFLAAPDVRR